MIKRTLYFGNPAYLRLSQGQLEISIPDAQGLDKACGGNTVPIEDIGIVLLDSKQITITHGLMQALLGNNVAVVSCDASHMPTGLFMPLSGNTTQHQRFTAQIEATKVKNKQLWQHTVQQKILNQAANLLAMGVPVRNMKHWAKQVQSGDAANHEARAAAYYWAHFFPCIEQFKRGRDQDPPNNVLNYGYAILRAVCARSLVASGLMPSLGIHHDNKYNAYCLADDIMEPYRPYVDQVVWNIVRNGEDFTQLSKSIKIQLMSIPTLDVTIGGRQSPLMVAMQQTAASLSGIFTGKMRKIAYPAINQLLTV